MTDPGPAPPSSPRTRRRHRLRNGRHALSRRLPATAVVAAVVVVAGGAYLGIRALLDAAAGGGGAVVATVVVALGFLPVAGRARDLADRRRHGARPTPYRVLADITALAGLAPTDTPDLAAVPETIARGVGARTCRLTVHRPGLRDRTHTWTDPGAGRPRPPGPGDGLDAEVEFPITRGDERIGALAVDRDAVSAGHRQLLGDIAAGLGAALQASRYGIELERQLRAALAHAEQIALARRHAVAEMDSERRRIERNLHDGAQHHLVALRLTLGLVEHQLHTGDLPGARERLAQLTTQIASTEAVLATTTSGVCSPTLGENGVVAALRDDLSATGAPITLDTRGVRPGRRYPPEVEDTVYYCCLEALTNAGKHAPGTAVTVHLAERDGALRFAVRDHGPGFTPAPQPATGTTGRGLRNLTARIAALGGRLTIDSTPENGTTVTGFVPVPAAPENEPDPTSEPTAPHRAASVPGEPATTALTAVDRPNTGARGAAVEGPAGDTAGTVPPRLPTLHDQVRAVLAEALAAYTDGAAPAQLHELAARLPDPASTAASAPCDTDPTSTRQARSVLLALDALVESTPPNADHATRLRFNLERIRAGAHELTELELIDTLQSGALAIPGNQRGMAEQLLGVSGTPACTRLGLHPTATPGDVRHAAQQQLSTWQHQASHPGAATATRHLAQVLVQTCERILASVSGH